GGHVATIAAPQSERPFELASAPVWSSDSRYVAIIENDYGGTTRNLVARDRGGVSVIDYDETPPAHQISSRITIVDRQRPQNPLHINVDDAVFDVDFGPDGTLYGARINNRVSEPSTELLAFNPTTGVSRTLYRTVGRFQAFTPRVSPDGAWIAGIVDADNRNWTDFASLILVNVTTGEVRRLTSDLSVREPIWARDGQEIYVLGRSGGLNQVWKVTLDGEMRQLTSDARRHFDTRTTIDGRYLAYQTEDGFGRRDVRVLDLESEIERVAYVVEEPATRFRLGEWRHIRWQSRDGVRPYGHLFLPPDFDPSRRYPLIVDIHGGGPGSFLYLWAPFSMALNPGPLEWHAWAAMGYVVLSPDYRSTGDYGPEPVRSRRERGAYSPIDDADDAISGVEYLIGQGYIDADRIAVIGHSAGGPRAYNAALARPDLFSALIVNEGVQPDPLMGNIQMLSGTMTGGAFIGMMEQHFNGTLAETPERFILNTTFEAARMDTPTLMMMGAQEHGGLGTQSWEVIYSLLRGRGTASRLLAFPDLGHNYTTPQSAVFAFEQARDWLVTHDVSPGASRTGD
ncbi:MAG TPA: prolyl oligopeptidase family serine peptidase, partial [Verrucomicrobiae bacterium]|nr:prolyl oligopeptidase family serine peptidase [Verrucomicrobiae bacterium]